MNIRHLVTKGVNSTVAVNQAIIIDGIPYVLGSSSKNMQEETIEYCNSGSINVDVIKSIEDGKEALVSSPIGDIILNERTNDILPLSRMFDYKVTANDALSQVIPVGATFADIVSSPVVTEFLVETASNMFGNINPNTGKSDIDMDAYYTPYIPLVSVTGCIPPQTINEKSYFNPQGVISLAECLDGLNSIKYGANSNISRKKTLDNISTEDDYFNEGYQACLSGISSPFFNLYRRDELTKPITRAELAYITVVCWTSFIEKFNNLYGSAYYLGVNFDWEYPRDILSQYNDGFNYKVSRISVDTTYNVTSLDLKLYRSDRTMLEYRKLMSEGTCPIPLPMFMSLVECGVLGLFHFEDGNLNPLAEVSRGEFSYFLVNLARIFTTKYIK